MAIVMHRQTEYRFVPGRNGRTIRKEVNVIPKLARNYCNRYSYVLKAHFDSKRAEK